jgi:uncharacterized protein (DUF2164 family)
MPRRRAEQASELSGPKPKNVTVDSLRAEDRWLDFIADLIAEDFLNQEPEDAHTLRRIRKVQ